MKVLDVDDFDDSHLSDGENDVQKESSRANIDPDIDKVHLEQSCQSYEISGNYENIMQESRKAKCRKQLVGNGPFLRIHDKSFIVDLTKQQEIAQNFQSQQKGGVDE